MTMTDDRDLRPRAHTLGSPCMRCDRAVRPRAHRLDRARTASRCGPRPCSRESGSAYIIALLALAVLTMMGLALALVTQSEVQLGGNERVVNRVFYAADTGIAVATARALVSGDYNNPKDGPLNISDGVGGSPLAMTNRVTLTPFCPILDAPCNLCEINDAGSYSTKSFRKINHAVTSTAVRLGPASTIVAQKSISSMMEFQPVQSSSDAYAACIDPAQLAQIKF